MKSSPHSSNPPVILDEYLLNLRASKFSELLSPLGVFLPEAVINPLFLELINAERSTPRKQSESASNWKWRAQRLKTIARSWIPSTAPSQSDLLFWPREETHVDQMAPLVQLTQRQGRLSFAVLASSLRAQDALSSHGIQYFDPTRLIRNRKTRIQGAIDQTEVALREWRKTPKSVISEFDEIFYEKLKNLLPLFFQHLFVVQKVFEQFSPRFLFVGNDLSPEGRTATLFSKLKKIPTASIQHGNLLNELSNRHVVDTFFVYGESASKYLAHRGLMPEQLKVVGAPYWDACVNRSRDRSKIMRQFKLKPNEPVVLIATSGPGHQISAVHHEELVESVFRMSANFPALQFVCKLHRKDTPALYDKLKRRHPQSRVKVIPHESRNNSAILDLLSVCSVLVTSGSTTAMEALAMQKPIITLDYKNETRGTSFIEQGLTMHCRSESEFKEKLELVPACALPPEEKSSAYVSKEFGPRDGLAPERILSAIEDQVRQYS